VADAISIEAVLPYSELPGFPQPNVGGHLGEAVIGRLGPTPILALCGRAHFYEGYSMEEVTLPIHALAAYGITHLLLTNSAGGINKRLRVGDFMLIEDHINLLPDNPLRYTRAGGFPAAQRLKPARKRSPVTESEQTGKQDSRFLDLSQAYDRTMAKMLKQAARSIRLRLKSGVYLAVSGPSYETPAEIRMLRTLGADAVGMSTVPEVIALRQLGVRVGAISCITNLAAGLSAQLLDHSEVEATARRSREAFTAVLSSWVISAGTVAS
jgi:purine-nucleoside phosphorylase